MLVFATGATGLIYEVTWQRYLSRLLGSDTMATAIIIGTFLGGLSPEYYLCGKLSVKIRNFFKVYALLEAIIALWCMMFPLLFDLFYFVTGAKPYLWCLSKKAENRSRTSGRSCLPNPTLTWASP